jgi:uncharacterized membrane protein
MTDSTSSHRDSNDTQTFLFRIAMWWRIGYGFLRLIFGFILLSLVGAPISDIFYRLASHELTQDPNDVLIQTLSPLATHFPITITYFIAIYFLFWGILDIVLSIQLLKHRMWAFPLTIALIGIFVIYEIYRFAHTHSLVLLGVIIVDIIVATLIYKEYKSHTVVKLST